LFLEPQDGDLYLSISDDGQKFVPYLGPDWEIVEVEGLVRLESGEKRQAIFSVLWNLDRFSKLGASSNFLAFPAPGSYVIKAQVMSGFGTIDSNAVKVDLVAPSGSDETIWQQIKTDSRLARFIQDPRPDGKDAEIVAGHLRGLLKVYAGSRYAAEFNATLEDYHHRKEVMKATRPQTSQHGYSEEDRFH